MKCHSLINVGILKLVTICGQLMAPLRLVIMTVGHSCQGKAINCNSKMYEQLLKVIATCVRVYSVATCVRVYSVSLCQAVEKLRYCSSAIYSYGSKIMGFRQLLLIIATISNIHWRHLTLLPSKLCNLLSNRSTFRTK